VCVSGDDHPPHTQSLSLIHVFYHAARTIHTRADRTQTSDCRANPYKESAVSDTTK
jgi:hypothetical protein